MATIGVRTGVSQNRRTIDPAARHPAVYGIDHSMVSDVTDHDRPRRRGVDAAADQHAFSADLHAGDCWTSSGRRKDRCQHRGKLALFVQGIANCRTRGNKRVIALLTNPLARFSFDIAFTHGDVVEIHLGSPDAWSSSPSSTTASAKRRRIVKVKLSSTPHHEMVPFPVIVRTIRPGSKSKVAAPQFGRTLARTRYSRTGIPRACPAAPATSAAAG